MFDREWAAELSADEVEGVEMDETGTRLSISASGLGTNPHHLTFRSAAPLSRPQCLLPPPTLDAAPVVHQQQQLPSYRIVVEAYGGRSYCYLGFIPSHMTRANRAVLESTSPTKGDHICRYGGWDITVYSSKDGTADPRSGWAALPPALPASAGGFVDVDQCSAYATTNKVPPVPVGSAVEFAVDYAAGTCRVAFYTPAAAAGGFMGEPYAKMELRFVAVDANVSYSLPAHPVPTAADSRITLYPAWGIIGRGAAVRFIA